MLTKVDDDQLLSAVSDAMAVLGDRWSLAVIAALLDGPRRYGELQSRLPGIAPNILSARLKKLEQEGLVVATAYSERPRRLAYGLTGDAHELSDLLRLLAAWGSRIGRAGGAPVHAECGTPLEVRWWCPTCAEVASAPAEDADIRV
jgi:DNA-binding HxlR family transcriptional regulator